ncbi:hypothetical protein M2R27_08170 [Aeromonas hydrophila]|uniref:hypothetical protein n=1 Tax=Aeromonas hydrophila TaxID=644 RepID=UPI00207C2CB9|nr:hypothetical protein [Aeromonas hydrophila]MCO4222132.1 hypothetical protein [Aeromonas hydrophila]
MQNEIIQEQPNTRKEPPLQHKTYTKRDFFCAIAVSIYLLLLLIPSIGYWYMVTTNAPPPWVVSIKQVIECVLVAVSGGGLYCLRAVYLNYSVRKQWDEVWVVWYLLRPFASGLMGFATYLIISAGLVAVGSPSAEHPEKLLYVLSFFAGLNVDGFLKKFEGQVSSSVKVKESRQTQGS